MLCGGVRSREQDAGAGTGRNVRYPCIRLGLSERRRVCYIDASAILPCIPASRILHPCPPRSTSSASATTASRPCRPACARSITDAEVLFGTERTLALVPEVEGRAARDHERPQPAGRDDRVGRRQAGRAAGLRRPDVLRPGPLRVRQARQGPVRRRAARQQHAAGVRPRDGEVGRSVPHRPGQASARRGAGKDSHGPEGRPVHDRPVRPGRGGQGAAAIGTSTTSRPTCARTSAPATNA